MGTTQLLLDALKDLLAHCEHSLHYNKGPYYPILKEAALKAISQAESEKFNPATCDHQHLPTGDYVEEGKTCPYCQKVVEKAGGLTND